MSEVQVLPSAPNIIKLHFCQLTFYPKPPRWEDFWWLFGDIIELAFGMCYPTMNTNVTLKKLVERVKTRLKDADYSDEDIKEFINDCYFEVLGETHYPFAEKCYCASATEGGNLEVPEDYQSLAKFTANDGMGVRSFRYMPYAEYFSYDDNDSRKNYFYTIFGNELLFSLPKLPENQYYTLQLFYLAKPISLLEDDDVPMFPEEFSEILVLGALKRAEQLRDNFDYAQIYDNQKIDLTINMKARYCPRQQQMANRAVLPVKIRTRF